MTSSGEIPKTSSAKARIRFEVPAEEGSDVREADAQGVLSESIGPAADTRLSEMPTAKPTLTVASINPTGVQLVLVRRQRSIRSRSGRGSGFALTATTGHSPARMKSLQGVLWPDIFSSTT